MTPLSPPWTASPSDKPDKPEWQDSPLQPTSLPADARLPASHCSSMDRPYHPCHRSTSAATGPGGSRPAATGADGCASDQRLSTRRTLAGSRRWPTTASPEPAAKPGPRLRFATADLATGLSGRYPRSRWPEWLRNGARWHFDLRNLCCPFRSRRNVPRSAAIEPFQPAAR